MTDEMGRRRSRDILRQLSLDTDFSNNNQEEVVSTELETFVPEDWKFVTLPDIMVGYEVSRAGDVVSPSGKLLQPSVQGVQLWVSLRRSDKVDFSRAVRVDKLVLLAFDGPPVGEHDIPIHLDGDTTNCHIENLAWGLPGDQHRMAPKPKETKKKSVPAEKPKFEVVWAEPTPAGGDEIEVLQVYRLGDVSVTVREDGSFTLPAMDFDAKSAKTLSRLIERIEEINKLVKRNQ